MVNTFLFWQAFPILIGDIDAGGDLNANIIHRIFPNLQCKFAAQVSLTLHLKPGLKNYCEHTFYLLWNLSIVSYLKNICHPAISFSTNYSHYNHATVCE